MDGGDRPRWGGTVPSWGMDSPYLNATAVGFDSNMSLHYKPPHNTPRAAHIDFGRGGDKGPMERDWGMVRDKIIGALLQGYKPFIMSYNTMRQIGHQNL